jgi:hypothetical protein
MCISTDMSAYEKQSPNDGPLLRFGRGDVQSYSSLVQKPAQIVRLRDQSILDPRREGADEGVERREDCRADSRITSAMPTSRYPSSEPCSTIHLKPSDTASRYKGVSYSMPLLFFHCSLGGTISGKPQCSTIFSSFTRYRSM